MQSTDYRDYLCNYLSTSLWDEPTNEELKVYRIKIFSDKFKANIARDQAVSDWLVDGRPRPALSGCASSINRSIDDQVQIKT